MESSFIGALSRAALYSKALKPIAIAVAIAIATLHLFSSKSPCQAQKPDTTTSSRFSTTSGVRFATPESTTAHWVMAVNQQDWREEYVCYAGAQQSKFTYQVMVSTRELSDSQDLSIELNRILQRYRFPANLVDDFQLTRLDVSHLNDPKLKDAAYEIQNEKRQESLKRWEHEVQPLNIDWASMIGELQPLFIRSYERHKHGIHPSSTGIAHHLHFHRFKRPSSLKVAGNRAEGSIIAIICDPDVVINDAFVPEPRGLGMISNWFDRGVELLPFVDRRAKRTAEKIGLVEGLDGWKIDLVPFR